MRGDKMKILRLWQEESHRNFRSRKKKTIKQSLNNEATKQKQKFKIWAIIAEKEESNSLARI